MCGEDYVPGLTEIDYTILAQLVDVHNHVGDRKAGIASGEIESDLTPATVRVKQMYVMSSTLEQDRTKRAASMLNEEMIAFYGLHPWWTGYISLSSPPANKLDHYNSILTLCRPTSVPDLDHLLPTLPEPISIQDFLDEMEQNLIQDPLSHVGEIGLDYAFRLRNPPSSSSITAKRVNTYSDYKVRLDHQVAVVEAQLRLAMRLKRSASFHTVHASNEVVLLFERMKKEHKDDWKSLRICLHSFGGSKESAITLQKAHPNVFFSFSMIISGRTHKFPSLVQSIESHRILLESDHSTLALVDRLMWDVFVAVRDIKGWSDEECLSIVQRNTQRFIGCEC